MDWPVVVSSFVSLALYWNTLHADFAYDDVRAIQKNPDLLPETPLINIFYDDFWGTPLTHSGSHKSYRPLCVLTFRLNYFLGGLSPYGYHLGNVLLHVIVTAVFVHVARLFLQRTFSVWIAGLLFASHPIHTEAVAGVVGRADIGACLFFLLAIVCYTNYCKLRSHVNPGMRRWILLTVSGVFTAASMLTKEQGITVLAVCAIYDMFVITKLKLHEIPQLLSHPRCCKLLEGLLFVSSCGVILLTFRLYFMGNKPPEFSPADNPASDSDSLLTRTLTFLYLPSINFWLLICPWTLSFDWSMEAIPLLESVSDVRNLVTMCFYVTLTFISIKILKGFVLKTQKVHLNGNGCLSRGSGHNPKHKHSCQQFKKNNAADNNRNVTGQTDRNMEVLIVSLAMMIFPFIPATNLFFYVGFVVAERVLYIPSMGFCLLIAEGVYLLHKHYKNQKAKQYFLILIIGLLLTCLAGRTVMRNADWSTEENLYRSGISINPAKAWGNLANIFNGQGKVKEAEQAYRSALQHRGNMADVHYNLGILLQDQKRYTEALESYQLAIQCRPRLTLAHLNMGIILATLNRRQDAEKTYQHCAEIDITGLKDPRLHESTKISCLYNLGRLYADQDQFQVAISTYLEAITRMPSHYAPQSIYNMLGESYFQTNQLEEAEHWYKEALRVKADHIPAHLTLAKLYHKKNLIAEAQRVYEAAITIDSSRSSIYQHYGQFLNDIGRHSQAADNFIIAAQRIPNDFDLISSAANSLRQAGRTNEAEMYYEQTVKLKPNMPTAHMNLGAMYHFNRKYEEAEQSYLAALRLKPDDSTTKENLQKLRNLVKSKDSKNENGKQSKR